MNENVVDPAIKENPPSDRGSDVYFFEDRIRPPIPALAGDLLFPFDIDAVQPFFIHTGKTTLPSASGSFYDLAFIPGAIQSE